ncbi:DUF5681 domain-containing protein [Ancylobacter sp. Lp-2]|uniref:DUF5681 domain-containing protein n=1 Tax=Ancylobacter sp. Lp-2 TaxID=2881339 RepID=UPI001E4325A6|nr:DUF5681 domain-containing protein [Ancylobacter sp. Lp-2]MCB4767115.1 DUF5681 domain-containing protein [Ancylobacter sp. Lp-2]
MAKGKNSKTDYEIGYRKPPEHTRFTPGTSGNPGGRKKGYSNLKTEFEEVLGRSVELSENRKKQIVTVRRALLLRFAQEALKDDIRAIEKLLDRAERYEGTESHEDEDLSDDDAELLERAIARRGQKPQPPKQEGGPGKGRTRKAKDGGGNV